MDQSSILKALKALAQETRLSIFLSLVKAGRTGLTAGTLARQFDLTAPTISFHLKTLQEASLIVGERRQQSIVYRANFERTLDVARYFVDNCCGGRLRTTSRRDARRRSTTDRSRAP